MHCKKTILALSLAAGSLSTHAAELYLGFGVPGAMIGVATPVSPSWTLRGEFATLGEHTEQTQEDGIDYDGRLKVQRSGLFADYFVFGGGFRLTGGVTFNAVELDLVARGNGGSIDIGGQTYNFGPNDRFDAAVRFAKTTPYIGIGYGHHADTGFGFVWDIGASIGRATVTAASSGPNLGQVAQSDIDRELQELRDGVGKVRVLPQFSFAISYKF
jgi:hypothetical protein